jgi:pSer/pThr/pTyr-binding forkhead associated (FHA) protein
MNLKFTIRHIKDEADQNIVSISTDPNEKIFIGSSENLKIRLNDPQISSLHCIVFVNEQNSVEIVDLKSKNGTWLNGLKISHNTLKPNDSVMIGSYIIEFDVVNADEEESREFQTTEIETSDKLKVIPEAINDPELKVESRKTLSPRKKLVIVDGEECDIEFNDSQYESSKEIPLSSLNFSNFIDLDSSGSSEKIFSSKKEKRLEVIYYLSSKITNIEYIKLVDGDLYFSNSKNKKNCVFVPGQTISKQKFMSFNGKNFQLYKLKDYEYSEKISSRINLTSALFITFGIQQISIRLTEEKFNFIHSSQKVSQPKSLRNILIFSFLLFLPSILFSFYMPVKILEKKNEIAVIYELPKEVEVKKEITIEEDIPEEILTNVETPEANDTEQNQPENITEEVLPENPSLVADPSPEAPSEPPPPPPQNLPKIFDKPQIKKEVVINSLPKKEQTPQRVETFEIPQKNVKAEPVQVVKKTYSFKSSTNLNDLSLESTPINLASTENFGQRNHADLMVSESINGAGTISSSNSEMTKLSDASKSGHFQKVNFRSLASKNTFDNMNITTKTVVLGSMDAELLRKILKEYIPQFRHCYQQELVLNSEMRSGSFDLNFSISPLGDLKKYSIESTENKTSKDFRDCIGKVLQIIPFPKPKGGGMVDVRQPLHFSSEERRL